MQKGNLYYQIPKNENPKAKHFKYFTWEDFEVLSELTENSSYNENYKKISQTMKRINSSYRNRVCLGEVEDIFRKALKLRKKLNVTTSMISGVWYCKEEQTLKILTGVKKSLIKPNANLFQIDQYKLLKVLGLCRYLLGSTDIFLEPAYYQLREMCALVTELGGEPIAQEQKSYIQAEIAKMKSASPCLSIKVVGAFKKLVPKGTSVDFFEYVKSSPLAFKNLFLTQPPPCDRVASYGQYVHFITKNTVIHRMTLRSFRNVFTKK